MDHENVFCDKKNKIQNKLILQNKCQVWLCLFFHRHSVDGVFSGSEIVVIIFKFIAL